VKDFGSEEAALAWAEQIAPNDLGDGNHRWSWLVRAIASRDELPAGVANYVPTARDILWLHRHEDRWFTGWIDLTSGTRHRLVSEDPLTIEPSILCPAGCGLHGFIRGGRWVPA